MAKAKILFWNADCSPSVDENGKQLFTYADKVNMVWNDDGTPVVDGCGNPLWTYKIIPPPPPPPVDPPGPPPIGPAHPPYTDKVQWKWIVAGILLILLVGLLIG